jgi:drug/metabolite transporter (DMT)-like permease
MSKIKGSLAILATALLYGSYGVWANLIGDTFDLFFQTYVRATLAWLIILGIVLYLKDWKSIKSFYDYKILFLIAIFGIFTQAIYYSYSELGVGLASILYFFAILVTQFFIGFFIYKENISFIKIISLTVSFFGVYLIFKNDIKVFGILPGSVALLAGFAVGAQASITKLISKKYSSWQISLFSWAGVILTCLPLSLYFNEKQIFPGLEITWIYLYLFAIMGLLVFPLLIYGYKKIDVSLGGLIGLVEIPAAIAFGYFFFNENITQSILIGSSIIVFAAALPDLYDLVVQFKNKL